MDNNESDNHSDKIEKSNEILFGKKNEGIDREKT